MKIIYLTAWVLVLLSVFVSVLTGSLGAGEMLVFSLVALALVYALALRSVVVNARDQTA